MSLHLANSHCQTKSTSWRNIIALLFPGQGSQAVGMGKDLAEKYPVARQTFEEADDALGYKLSTICFEGPEDQLRLTEITQPAILTASIAALRVLETRIPKPCLRRGTQSRRIFRARCFRDVSVLPMPSAPCATAASICRRRCRWASARWPRSSAWTLEKVTAVCHDAAQGEVCEPANINSPEQIVISGNTAAVERAAKLADERGAKRAKLLPVSAPFHCSLMKPAQDRLEGRSRRPQDAKAGLSGRLQRRRRTCNRRSARPRHACPTSHRIGEMGAVHAPADRARRADFHRSWTRKSSVRTDAAD